MKETSLNLKRTESRVSNRYTYTSVCYNITHSSQKVNQSKCPLPEECTNKIWCIHAMKYYSAIKRNEVLTHAMTWMNLENIILSEISQTQQDKQCIISLT